MPICFVNQKPTEAQLQKMSKHNDRVIREFLRSVGSKGGKRSSKHPDRKRLNREAAQARWRKTLPVPKPLEAAKET